MPQAKLSEKVVAEDSSFLEATEDWFFKIQFGHMGCFLYDYDIQDDTYRGITDWHDWVASGLVTREDALLQYSLPPLSDILGKDRTIVEFGPGTMKDAESLLSTFECPNYVAIDVNPNVQDIGKKLVKEKFPNCKFEYRNLDFFKESELVTDTPAIGVLLGMTIGNIPSPITSYEPKEKLTSALSNLSSFLPDDSYMMITTDVCQNGNTNIKYYSHQVVDDLLLSLFYRMNVELPMKNFEPDAFEYKPVWIPESSLLAHTAMATKNQRFKIAGKEVWISKGDSFHIHNSYRFKPFTFEECARKAGLSVVQYWQKEPDTVRLYLLKKEQKCT